MSKLKAARTAPKISGSRVYGKDELLARKGNSVFKHRNKYHVYVGLNEVLVTDDVNAALAKAASTPAT